MITSQTREIQALVEDIRDRKLLLPELQRRYVWKAPQVRDLFDSLYHQYPSGQLLVWETDDLPFSRTSSVESVEPDQIRPQLLLDGQQRLTSLAAVMLGRPLVVRGSKRPIDIAFNLYTEKFEVAGPRQAKEAGWISLAKLYTEGAMSILMDLKLDMAAPETKEIYERLQRIDNVKTYKYHVSVLEKLSYDEVTHIFVRINSGGTTLGSADLALAQISSRWRGVTQELSDYQNAFLKQGNKLWIDTGILLRTLSVFLTGQTRLGQLFRGDRQQITVIELEATWNNVKRAMDQAIAFLVGNCKMDRLDLLPTQYVLIPLTAYFHRHGHDITAQQARELQRWVYMALIWTRYSGSAESAADQDVAALAKELPLRLMIQNIEDKVGKRPVTERELREQRKNSPFMVMSYILARNNQAQDWFNSVTIGGNQNLELHHIFPKEVLRESYDLKADSRTVDQVANLAFLSRRANSRISSKPPSEYLPSIDQHNLRAQYVPLESSLWTIQRFEDFLLERRTLLADGINQLLQSLTEEPSLWPSGDVQILETRVDVIERQLRDLIAERLEEARGEHAFELLPTNLRSTLTDRIAQKIRQNPFDAARFDSFIGKLESCQFSDYPKIIRSNWSLFEDDFGDESLLMQHHKAVTEARNALKHNNELNRSSRALAEAGLLWLEDCLRAVNFRKLEEQADGSDDL
jgi:hypothetical protein